MGKWRFLGLMGLAACGSSEHGAAANDAGDGADAAVAMLEHDAGRDSGEAYARDSGGSEPVVEAGSGGTPAESGGAGSEAAGQPAQSSGGAGSVAQGGAGSPAAVGGAGAPAQPVEHVLWSQAFSCGIHMKVASPGDSTAKFALTIDAGQDCRFGLKPSELGTNDFTTDAKCIAANPMPQGQATLFDSMGTRAFCGRATLDGFAAAVSGHKITKLHRSQSFTISIQGGIEGTPQSWTEGDVTGTWEAWGL
jgi:hypothetical protein